MTSVLPTNWRIDIMTGDDEEEEKKTQSEEEAESGTSKAEKGVSRGSVGATPVVTGSVVGVAPPAPPTATCGCFGVAGEPLPPGCYDPDPEDSDDDAAPCVAVATPHPLIGATSATYDEKTTTDEMASTGWGCFQQQQQMKESELLGGETSATYDEEASTDEEAGTGWGCFHHHQQMKEPELLDGATIATYDEATSTDEAASTGWGCFLQPQQIEEPELLGGATTATYDEVTSMDEAASTGWGWLAGLFATGEDYDTALPASQHDPVSIGIAAPDEDYDTDSTTSTTRSSSGKKKKKRKKKRRTAPSDVPPHGEAQAVAINTAIAPSPLPRRPPPAALVVPRRTANLCVLLVTVLGVLNVVLVSAALHVIVDVRRVVSDLSTTCAAGYCECDDAAPTPSSADWTAGDDGGGLI